MLGKDNQQNQNLTPSSIEPATPYLSGSELRTLNRGEFDDAVSRTGQAAVRKAAFRKNYTGFSGPDPIGCYLSRLAIHRILDASDPTNYNSLVKGVFFNFCASGNGPNPNFLLAAMRCGHKMEPMPSNPLAYRSDNGNSVDQAALANLANKFRNSLTGHFSGNAFLADHTFSKSQLAELIELDGNFNNETVSLRVIIEASDFCHLACENGSGGQDIQVSYQACPPQCYGGSGGGSTS